eukprot:3847129-Prymnesium_polylepis.2
MGASHLKGCQAPSRESLPCPISRGARSRARAAAGAGPRTWAVARGPGCESLHAPPSHIVSRGVGWTPTSGPGHTDRFDAWARAPGAGGRLLGTYIS